MIGAMEHRARTGPWQNPPQRKFGRNRAKPFILKGWCIIVMMTYIIPFMILTTDMVLESKVDWKVMYGKEGISTKASKSSQHGSKMKWGPYEWLNETPTTKKIENFLFAIIDVQGDNCDKTKAPKGQLQGKHLNFMMYHVN